MSLEAALKQFGVVSGQVAVDAVDPVAVTVNKWRANVALEEKRRAREVERDRLQSQAEQFKRVAEEIRERKLKIKRQLDEFKTIVLEAMNKRTDTPIVVERVEDLSTIECCNWLGSAGLDYSVVREDKGPRHVNDPRLEHRLTYVIRSALVVATPVRRPGWFGCIC